MKWTLDTFKKAVYITPGYRLPARQSRTTDEKYNKHAIVVAKRRKDHPCFYIDFSRWTRRAGCGCPCGTVYGCKKYGECAITPSADCRVRSCVFCESYTERVTLPTVPVSLSIPVGVTTCPLIRNGKVSGHRDTLPKTLNSILAAGWARDDVTIFGEPESHVPAGWRIIWRASRLGPWSNLFAGLTQLRAEEPNADGYLFLEDDTWLANGVRAELERRGLPRDPNWGLVRLFRMSGRGTPWRNADTFCDPKRTDGYQPVRHGEFLWGTNAVLFSPLAVDRLASDRIGGEHEDSPDIKIGKLMVRYGLSEWTCNPSLAQTDASKPSAVGHGLSPAMQSDTFVDDAGLVGAMYG